MSGTANVVTFVFTDWIAEYPEFALVPLAQAQNYFNMACVQLNNTPASQIPLTDCAGNLVRQPILYAATAHIAQLFWIPPGATPSPLVGRISNASEGSVSVAVDMGAQPMSAAWWNQTRYGAMAWMMTQPYRMARYAPRFPRYLGTAGTGRSVGRFN